MNERKKCNRGRQDEKRIEVKNAKQNLYKVLSALSAKDLTESEIDLLRILSQSLRAEQ